MPDADWYRDPGDPSMLRYFDGARWTEHTHPAPTDPAAGPTAGRPDTTSPIAEAASTNAEPATATATKGTSMTAEVLSIAFLGAFIGIMLGGALLNGLGALSPVTVEQGTLERLEIDVSLSDSTNPSNRTTYLLRGTTDAGTEWQIADDEAYRIVDDEGYPQRVTVGIADWTGKAAQVTGETWSVDRQSTGNRIAWGVAVGFMVVVGLIGVLITSRAATHTLASSATFAFGFFVVGNWLGYTMFSWIQSA